jgi:peptidoglycan/xylan/chitin deacetylase (PgdA/CDA1 family)
MTTLHVLDQADVKATWCVMYPGGYRSATYTAIRSQGHELALHYNAMEDDARSRWGEADFDFQWRWLQDRSGVPAVTNKNHYLRWEGATEFYRWYERRGIRVDQTKGPSKQGNIGFLFGSCHPWFPIEDTEDGMRRMDVLEIPLLSQDLVWTVPFEVCRPLLDQCVRHHGVAHFLFHPHHIHTKPEVARAVVKLIEEGRERGLAWWTAEEIDRWERLRRQVDLVCRKKETGEWEILVRSDQDLPDATLLILAPDSWEREMPPLSFTGLSADQVRFKRMDGFDFYEVRGAIRAGEAHVRLGGGTG